MIGLLCGLAGVALAAYNRNQSHSQAATIVQQDAGGTDVSAQLERLRSYVNSHMGASVSLVLNGAYQRQEQAAQAAAQPQMSGDVYQQAQAACAPIKNAVQQAQCNQNYLNSHLQTATPSPVAQPSQNDFRYAFNSPVWTPDAAGILSAISIFFLLAAVGRLLFGRSKPRPV